MDLLAEQIFIRPVHFALVYLDQGRSEATGLTLLGEAADPAAMRTVLVDRKRRRAMTSA